MTNPILPPAMLDCFRQFRGSGDAGRWAFGDAIADAVVELAGKVSQAAVYRAAALETDLSPAEVRVLHETSRAFDEPLRGEFADVLTFQHYRVLRYVGDRAQQRKWLAWCVETADEYGGRPAPAVKLAAKLAEESGNLRPEPTVAELCERVRAGLLRVYEREPAALYTELARFITAMVPDEAAGPAAQSCLKFAAAELDDAAHAWGQAAPLQAVGYQALSHVAEPARGGNGHAPGQSTGHLSRRAQLAQAGAI